MTYDAIHQKIVGDSKYVVVIDEDSLARIFHNFRSSWDFGDEEENRKYLMRFKREELCSYGVKKLTRCGECETWGEVDSLWDIHAESAEEALECYLEHNAETLTLVGV